MKEKINRYFEKQISLAERCAKESKGYLRNAHWNGYRHAMIVAQREIKEMYDQEQPEVDTEYIHKDKEESK